MQHLLQDSTSGEKYLLSSSYRIEFDSRHTGGVVVAWLIGTGRDVTLFNVLPSGGILVNQPLSSIDLNKARINLFFVDLIESRMKNDGLNL